MRSLTSSGTNTILTIALAILCLPQFGHAARVTNPKRVPKNAVLLSKVSTLTLRAGKQTSYRRVGSIPQLQCVGPSSVCKLYEVDVLRCKNQGADYDENDVQWTCTASLPEEFKLGSTDVTCEGYESSDDPYILKGSCGVQYRLLLTSKGEEKFGKNAGSEPEGLGPRVGAFLFWLLFGTVVLVIALSAAGCIGRPRPRNTRGGRRGGGGGGGGGGNDPWDDDPRGPPPPYDYGTSGRKTTSNSRTQPAPNQGWRPGFWSGTLGGAAAGYLAGQRGNLGRQQAPDTARSFWNGGSYGEGSSRHSSSSSASSSPSFSNRHESSGFGSTSRR